MVNFLSMSLETKFSSRTSPMPADPNHPVRFRDCISFCFISAYTFRPHTERQNLVATLRHYAILVTAVLFVANAAASSYWLTTLPDASFWLQVGGPVTNALCAWIMAWGFILLRDTRNSVELIGFRMDAIGIRPLHVTLSMGRKMFDLIIGFHLLFTSLVFGGWCWSGMDKDLAQLIPLMAFAQTIISILIVALGAGLPPQSFEEYQGV